MSATVTITRGLSLQKRLEGVSWDDIDAVTLSDARRLWSECGGPSSPNARLLTNPNHSTKAKKSKRWEYLLYLAPHRIAGVRTVCPWSSAGCRGVCLYYSGHGSFEPVQAGRIAKTHFATLHPEHFLALLIHEFGLLANRSQRQGFRHDQRPYIRLNGTSDNVIEDVPVLAESINSYYSHIEFADYTKANIEQRPEPKLDNYRLVRSVWADKPVEDLESAIGAGAPVALCVDNKEPLLGLAGVVDADKTDEWIFSGARVGLLSPKFPATAADAWDYRTVRGLL